MILQSDETGCFNTFSADDEVAAIRRNRMLRRSHGRGLTL
jgi:hypothetical protein